MKASLFESIPIEVRENQDRSRLLTAEWSMDEQGIFKGIRKFPEGTPLALACSWLEKLRSLWSASLVRLDDGRVILFTTEGFAHLEAAGFSFSEKFILYDEEQLKEKDNSELFIPASRMDRPFSGSRWLPIGSVLLGPRLRMEDPFLPDRIDALTRLGLRLYVRLEAEPIAEEQGNALFDLLAQKSNDIGFIAEGTTWKVGVEGGGFGFKGTLGEWLTAKTPEIGFIYVEGEADLIEAAERSWLMANGRKDPYQQEKTAYFQRTREPGACIMEGGRV